MHPPPLPSVSRLELVTCAAAKAFDPAEEDEAGRAGGRSEWILKRTHLADLFKGGRARRREWWERTGPFRVSWEVTR